MKETLTMLALAFGATSPLPVQAGDTAPPASAEVISADAVLRQMSAKLGAARKFSFKARREIDSGLAGGDGLHGTAEIAVTVQRPDKMMASATIPGDVRRFYFDGKQLTLVDVGKKVYSTVPLAASLNKLPSELAAIYGFMPPLADLVVSNLYEDLAWRAQSVDYRGIGTIKTGFLGLKRIQCHRVALLGKQADSELWIAMSDLLPRRWTATLKRAEDNVGIRLELSEWNLEAKIREEDFVFSPDKDALQVPMMTEAEMAEARKQVK